MLQTQTSNSLLAPVWEGLGEGAQGRPQEGTGWGGSGEMDSQALLVLAAW